MGEADRTKTNEQPTPAAPAAPAAPAEEAQADDRLEPGTYFVGNDGNVQRIHPGCYVIDEAGSARPAPPGFGLAEKIPWDKVIAALEDWGKSRTGERKFAGVGRMLLATAIVGCATALAILGRIEGQAIVGFLGAAIGYVLARSTSPRA